MWLTRLLYMNQSGGRREAIPSLEDTLIPWHPYGDDHAWASGIGGGKRTRVVDTHRENRLCRAK